MRWNNSLEGWQLFWRYGIKAEYITATSGNDSKLNSSDNTNETNAFPIFQRKCNNLSGNGVFPSETTGCYFQFTANTTYTDTTIIGIHFVKINIISYKCFCIGIGVGDGGVGESGVFNH